MEFQRTANKLRNALREFSVMTAGVVGKFPNILENTSAPFESIARLWLVDSSTTNFDEIENAKSVYNERGFDGDLVVSTLNELLTSDYHLRVCCAGSSLLLLIWMGKFVDRFVPAIEREFPEARFDDAVEFFLNKTYETPFSVHLFRRLHNFNSDVDKLDFGQFEVIKLSPTDIQYLLRDDSVLQMFHSHNTSDYFMRWHVPNDPAIGDQQTFRKIGEESLEALGVLRYYKDGFLDSDYFVLHYQPSWVNSIRNVTPFGRTYTSPYADGKQLFHLAEAELGGAKEWIEFFFFHVKQHLKARESTDIGKRMSVATEFFASSFSEETEEQRLIDLMVVLEALFSPNDKSELNFKMCLYAAQLVERNPTDRIETFKFLTKMYGVRSQFVHGTLPMEAYLSNKFVSSADNDRLTRILRRAILHIVALSLGGRSDLAQGSKPVHTDIKLSLLDQNLEVKLRDDSDIESAVIQLRNTISPGKSGTKD